jgi:3-deoxy-D-manno-octulosonic-acid transferase
MLLFFYSLALYLLLLVSSPLWLFRILTTEKYRHGLPERLGRLPHRVLDASKPSSVIWVHAVSVGEVLAASRLIDELQKAVPGYRVVISTTTRTGQELARAKFGEHRVFYFPLDLGWVIRRYLDALRPSLVVLMETEFWPNFLGTCQKRGIPVAVVNARISDRSYPRYLRLGVFWRRILSALTLALAQTEDDRSRLIAIGVPAERVCVAGNLKFDVRTAQPAGVTTALLAHLPPEGVLLVAGSTLQGEESLLLEAWPQILAAVPQVRMVLAPRHPERFAAVATLLANSRIPSVRRSEWMPTPANLSDGSVFLLDSIGELASVYSLASVAFVGGSLVPAGGHNPLEPAQFSVPVVMGPHYANFRAIVETLCAEDAIRIAEPPHIAEVLIEFMRNPSAARAMGDRGRHVFEREAGATGRAVDALLPLLGRARQ